METLTNQKTAPLKGGEFLIKDENLQHVFVPEEKNEEQLMIQNMVRDFMQSNLDSVHELSEQVRLIEEAGELGLLGAHMPESLGGMNLDTNTNTIIGEEIGQSGGSFNTSFAAHTGIGMLPILYFGTAEQQEKYLPKLITGEYKAAYCLTEPSSGSDALSAKSKAALSDDGSKYIITGQKMWISNAGFADLFIVFAQVDGDKFTGFIVESKTPGITLGAEEKKLGIKGSSTRQVFFEQVEIPAENLLGEVGKGHLIAFNALNIGRYKLGNMAMGGCKLSCATSIQYANERIQFKKPISSFGAIKEKIANQAIQTFVLESSVYRTSQKMNLFKTELLNDDVSFSQAGLQSAEEYAIECAIIKVAGSEYLNHVTDEMVQIHGGNGFSEEFPAARAYRDQRINRIYEGTNEINRILIMNMLLKRAMKGHLDLVGPAWDVQKELTQFPKNILDDTPYAQEYKSLKDFKKLILMTAGAAVKKQMDGELNLRKEQEILMACSDLLIQTYLAESTLLRVHKAKDFDKEYPHEIAEAILRVFFQETSDYLSKRAKDALCAFASGDLLKTMLLGVKRFASYPPLNTTSLRREIANYLIDKNTYAL